MKIVDEKEKDTQKTTKTTNKDRRVRENRSYSERERAKWFCYAFKFGHLQLICNVSLIFRSNLVLTLSIILKQRELNEPKHVSVECRCLKIWDLLSFLVCSSILVLQWHQVLPMQLELQLAQVNSYTRKDFKLLEIQPLYEK